jgi:hypothetical protein
VAVQIVDLTGKTYSDQTSRFPHTSSRGHKYVMIFYDHDSNAILAEPIKSRSQQALVQAFSKLHLYLRERGLQPLLHILDNECPATLKSFIRSQGATFQLAPPHLHRTNAAEKAIDTWKCHFISCLSTCHPDFPMHLWCRLIPQATTTLNLLRPSRINPRLSAEAQLNGVFDFNRTPLAPPGTKILVHEAPAVRGTWAPHGVDGWYLGPAVDHYRCYRVYITTTAAERISKTVEFFPHSCAMPRTSSADAARHAALDLVSALQNPAPAAPFAPVGQAQQTALQQLSAIFLAATRVPTTLPTEGSPQAHAPTAAPLPRVPSPLSIMAPHSAPPCPHSPLRSPLLRSPAPPSALTRHHYPLRSLAPRYPLRSQQANTVLASGTGAANTVMDSVTGAALEYRHLVAGPNGATWETSLANDLGRLAQGIGTRMPSGTNTIFFIAKSAIPTDRKVTYARLVSSLRPHKTEVERVRVTVGGDRLDFPGATTTHCASLTTTKCLLNSVLSTPNAKFMTLDVKDFYYGTPMKRFEYMRILLAIIPAEVVQHYNLDAIASNGYVYMEIRKGMPGLKQAGRLASDRLTQHLATAGYAPVRHTPALWNHATNGIVFSLVVDDFGVKYVHDADAQHLITSLKSLYTISTDWTGSLYCGLTLAWDYTNRTVDVSMPGYVAAALHRFQHAKPSRRQDAPHAWTQPTYGAKIQFAEDDDNSPLLSPLTTNLVQQIVGVFLYYAIAVDPTMLVALGSIAADQANATERTYDAAVWLLNYADSNPDATIRYVASDMILHLHSNASYLSAPKARSRAGGHFFLSSLSTDPTLPPTDLPPQNGPLHTVSKILRNVMGSAAEAEIGATYVNCQEAVPIRTTLAEMGHPQPRTPVQVDNSTACGFANDTIKQKRSKAIDMRFHWIKDRMTQLQFLVYWRPGHTNKADLHTKHFSPAHHRLMRHEYLHPTDQLAHHVVFLLQRGCDNSGVRPPIRPRHNIPPLKQHSNRILP